MFSFGTQKSEWPININLPELAQAGYDILDFRPFLSPLIPAVLNEFPCSRRKTQLRGVNRLGGAFTLHHHELDLYVYILWEGKFPGKNLAKMVRAQVNSEVMMASYLDDDHPESINVRHLGRTQGFVILCRDNFRCSPTDTVGAERSGSVVRNGVRGNRRNSEITDSRDPRDVEQNVQLTDDRQQMKLLQSMRLTPFKSP